VCPATLTRAQVAPEQVDFYASHQGTAWFREATQAALGLSRARFVDTWEDTASVYSSNIPLCLHMGRQNGSLSRGDTTLMFSGGGGTTYTCGVMKWSV
jgi:3-oxoacyl-[acyl-carrier-protein] synthase III